MSKEDIIEALSEILAALVFLVLVIDYLKGRKK